MLWYRTNLSASKEDKLFRCQRRWGWWQHWEERRKKKWETRNNRRVRGHLQCFIYHILLEWSNEDKRDRGIRNTHKYFSQKVLAEDTRRFRLTMESNSETNINESRVASIHVIQTMDSCTNKDNVSTIFMVISFITKNVAK